MKPAHWRVQVFISIQTPRPFVEDLLDHLIIIFFAIIAAWL